MESYSLGVEPSQIPEAVAHAEFCGVPTDFNPENGDAILRNPKHRAALSRTLKIHDRNAGYSDPSPGDPVSESAQVYSGGPKQEGH